VDLALHVPVHDFRHVGPALGAAECGAAPDAAGDELERPRADFRSRRGHADDDALAPALVAALQRLTHHIDIADAFEAVVGPALRQADQIGYQVALHLLRVDEMRHAELLGHGAAAGIEVDADDHVGAGDAQTLNDVEADAAQPEDDAVR